MQNRLVYIDEMKGFAILLVCMGHLLAHSSLGNLQPTLIVIASFHMAFFFFLSGYVNQRTHKIESIGVSNFVKKTDCKSFDSSFLLVIYCTVFSLWSYSNFIGRYNL